MPMLIFVLSYGRRRSNVALLMLRLRKLKEAEKEGLLTEEEYNEQKKCILQQHSERKHHNAGDVSQQKITAGVQEMPLVQCVS